MSVEVSANVYAPKKIAVVLFDANVRESLYYLDTVYLLYTFICGHISTQHYFIFFLWYEFVSRFPFLFAWKLVLPVSLCRSCVHCNMVPHWWFITFRYISTWWPPKRCKNNRVSALETPCRSKKKSTGKSTTIMCVYIFFLELTYR